VGGGATRRPLRRTDLLPVVRRRAPPRPPAPPPPPPPFIPFLFPQKTVLSCTTGGISLKSRHPSKWHTVTAREQGLPLTKDTLRLRREKEELENQICDVEDAIKLFSRPKVYVQDS